MSDRPTSPPPRFSRSSTIQTLPLAPSYHSSTGIGPSPSYARQPRPDELLLAQGNTRRRLNGQFLKHSKLIAVSLAGQEPRCTVPMFGRGAAIESIITLTPEATQNVLKLQVKVEGEMKLVIAEGGQVTHSLLSQTIPLFYSATPVTCPETHSFLFRLPTRFDDGTTQRPLPPTYEVNFPGVPGIRAAVRYWISVKLVRKKIWKRKELITIPFTYYPRARPPQPIVGLSFLSSLKSHPEEWSMFTSTVPPRNPSPITSVTSSVPILPQFVLPSSTIFPMSRKIPFHLQLSLESAPNSLSSTRSLDTQSGSNLPHSPSLTAAFIANPTPASSKPSKRSGKPPDQNNSSSASQSAPSSRRFPFTNTLHPPPDGPKPTLMSPLLTDRATIKVTLQRQISVDVRNQKVLKTVVCGEGFVRRVHLDSPPASSPYMTTSRGLVPQFDVIPEDNNLRGEESSTAHGPFGRAASGMGMPSEDDPAYDIEEAERVGHGEFDDDEQDWAGWEGEVIPSPQIQVGGFRAAGLAVRDFIILNLIPPDPHSSPLRAHQHAVPVRIVTDAWEGDEDTIGAGF